MKDLTGQKFGYLTVLEQCEKIPYKISDAEVEPDTQEHCTH